jgi:hypothetical protein
MAKSIYVAGPMSGLPNFNFPAFFTAAERLEKDGWTVYNPAAKEEERTYSNKAYAAGDQVMAANEGFNFRECYFWDVEKVINSNAIYMLPNWEQSAGARGEHAVAVAMKKHYPEYQIIYE